MSQPINSQPLQVTVNWDTINKLEFRAEEAEQMLAVTRLQLGQAQEAEAAARYELEALRATLKDVVLDGSAQTVLRIWDNCLGNRTRPKAHWVDSLGMTTRLLNEDKAKARQQAKESEASRREEQSIATKLRNESQQLREQIQRLEAELAFAREIITAKNKRIQAALKVNT